MSFISKIKKNFLKIIIYLLIILVTARYTLALNVTPTNMAIEVTEFEPYNYSVKVHYDNQTPHNFTIYNVTMNNLPSFRFFPIAELKKNETKDLKFQVKTNTTLDQFYMTKVTYFYLTNTTRQKSNHTIILNSTGFHPYDMHVNLNDTILIYNEDYFNHTMTNLSNEKSIEIPVNATYTIIVKDLKNISYIDEDSSTGLNVIVHDNNYLKPTINPNYDIGFSFHVRSLHSQSQLKVIKTDPSSPIEYNENSVGVLVLRANRTIYNLKLTSNGWTTFSENNFNLDKEKVITFTVNPKNITNTLQTGKTYTVPINITGDNIAPIGLTYPIGIIRHNFTGDELLEGQKAVYIPMSIAEQRKYCEDNDWDEDFCYTRNKTIEKAVYIDREYSKNYSQQEINEMTDINKRVESDIGTVKTRIENLNTDVGNRLELNEDKIGNLTEKVNDNSEKLDDIYDFVSSIRQDENVRGNIWTTLIILTVITVVIFLIVKIKLKKKRVSISL